MFDNQTKENSRGEGKKLLDGGGGALIAGRAGGIQKLELGKESYIPPHRKRKNGEGNRADCRLSNWKGGTLNRGRGIVRLERGWRGGSPFCTAEKNNI